MNSELAQVTALQNKKVLIGAGGTGGHVYPALALATRLKEQGVTVEWLGTAAGLESQLVPNQGIRLHTIFIQGLRGNGIKRLMKAPLTIALATFQAYRVIKQAKPHVFIGFGGFASGPGALAAKLGNIPVVLHEQNATMGLTNKWVSKWAKKVLLAFPIAGCQGEVVGNPIRPSIVQTRPARAYIRREKPFRILVVGGSLGAKAINEIVPKALAGMIDDIALLHQTGKTTFAETQKAYKTLGIADKVSVVAYIDDMDTAYANSDLVIARSGALTVSEVASAGLPALFIPLPHAVDNHQFLNAQFLQRAGAAVIIEQKELSTASLHAQVVQLLDGETLVQMATNAKKCSHETALVQMIKALSEVVDGQ